MQPISLYEDAAAKTLNRLKYNDYILGLFLSDKVISDIDAFVQAKCLVYFGIFIVESMHYKPAIDKWTCLNVVENEITYIIEQFAHNC